MSFHKYSSTHYIVGHCSGWQECSVNETDQASDLVGFLVKLSYKMCKLHVLLNNGSFWSVRI